MLRRNHDRASLMSFVIPDSSALFLDTTKIMCQEQWTVTYIGLGGKYVARTKSSTVDSKGFSPHCILEMSTLLHKGVFAPSACSRHLASVHGWTLASARIW
jgi:hypothetical protein